MTARAKVATPFVQVIPEPLSDNPLPWLTAEWLRDGAFSAEATEGMRSLVRAPEAMSPEDRKRLAFALDASLGALRSTVSALQDSADTYSVRLGSPEGTAATRWASRSVEIGAGPLVDETLSAPQRAAVMAGLVFHEVGHVRYTRLINPARQRDWKGVDAPTEAIVAKVSNIVEDVRTEALDRDAFPGLAPALDAVIRWVGDRTAREHPGTFPKCFDLTNREGRIEALVGVLRYSWLADFTGNEATAEYIREAMGRALVAPTVKAIVAVIRELSEWVLAVPSKPAEAPTEPTDDEDEDEGEDAQPVDGTGSGFDSDGEDEDEDSEGDESEAPEDEDAEDEDSDADDGEGDSDEGDESEGEGQSEGDDSEDGEDGTEGGSDGEDESEDGDESDEGSEGTEDGDEDESGEDEGSESNGAGTRAPGERTEDEDGEDEGESTEDESERSHRPESEDAPGTGTLPAGCIGDEARTGVDEAGQTLADYAHSMARKVERARRYPSPNGEGDGIIVREREIVPPPPVVRKSHAPEAYISPDEGESIAEGSGDIVKARRVASKSKRKSRRSYAGEISVTTDRILIGQTLAGAISSARRGRTAPEHGCRSGRLDRSRLARVAQHDYRVFTREDQPSPERVRAHILIDASGSMADGVFRGTGYESTYEAKVTTAAQAARDLAVAIDSISWITARIYAHTTDWDSVAGGHRPYVVPLWRSGEDREAINGIFSIPGGNNFDGYAIAYVADDLLEERESREKPLVIVISDGMPAGLTGVREHTARTVDFYRARGVRIVAVSIDPTVTAEAMRQLYGDDVVAYDAHPAAFARNLAAVIGSSI